MNDSEEWFMDCTNTITNFTVCMTHGLCIVLPKFSLKYDNLGETKRTNLVLKYNFETISFICCIILGESNK
ncbi:hypothetical protein BpHYR1_005032 [Brachionus plicatilis]|uniref:Uncharacterized protein n=1 Tax=Brachionus plicatilis TaxID=10195 RepID=A0A3M7QV58_BRAPC|nr:hypothetical protein BpHYR1_005032 [Brachionus plicatilis]